MIDESKLLCICGHTEGFHSGFSIEATHTHKAYWCCTGNWRTGRSRCKCYAFRLAIAQPSNAEGVENPDPS